MNIEVSTKDEKLNAISESIAGYGRGSQSNSCGGMVSSPGGNAPRPATASARRAEKPDDDPCWTITGDTSQTDIGGFYVTFKLQRFDIDARLPAYRLIDPPGLWQPVLRARLSVRRRDQSATQRKTDGRWRG